MFGSNEKHPLNENHLSNKLFIMPQPYSIRTNQQLVKSGLFYGLCSDSGLERPVSVQLVQSLPLLSFAKDRRGMLAKKTLAKALVNALREVHKNKEYD